jgi:peptide/nickel transport system permease protein
MMVDPNMPAETIELRKEALGLNDNYVVRYFKWAGMLLHGDFGYSMATFAPVSQMLLKRVGSTLVLMGSALLVGIGIAIPIGVYSASKRATKRDDAITVVTLIGISFPDFVFGLIFIFIFAVKLRWLPTSGRGGLIHLILPVMTLAVGIAANQIRYVRAAVLETLDEDYLRTASAKGLSSRKVIWVHALRNALTTIVSVTGMQVATILGGAVVVEQIFSWPGIGQLMYQSVVLRDYNTLMAINLIAAVTVLLVNLATDIIYTIADPRGSYG